MKFIMKVGDEDGDVWEEKYDLPEITTLDEAKKWGEFIIVWFNNTRRGNEKKRAFIDVRAEEAMRL